LECIGTAIGTEHAIEIAVHFDHNLPALNIADLQEMEGGNAEFKEGEVEKLGFVGPVEPQLMKGCEPPLVDVGLATISVTIAQSGPRCFLGSEN